jgi:hypothetical protein
VATNAGRTRVAFGHPEEHREHDDASHLSDEDEHRQPVQNDPSIAGQHTYWESNGQVTRNIRIP